MNQFERLTAYVEDSFLKPLLENPYITDVSYNGVDIFYENSKRGRRKWDEKVSSEQVGDFLRQIANFAEKQFSYLEPVLDVSFSRYRLNASFLSVTRVRDKKSYSFALRIGHEGTAIADDSDFFGGKSRRILLKALANHESIVIAGETGSGKTELQKYLLLHLPPSTRVIVIDNVEELELSRGDGELDLTSWLVDEKNPHATFSALIKNALRNNPDYLLVAESRGKEMLDALSCVMSGHPIITTLHAKDLKAMPYRMARMAMMAGDTIHYDDVLGDIYHHFTVMVYLRKKMVDGEIKRYIETIGRLDEESQSIEVIYSISGNKGRKRGSECQK